VTSIDTDLDRFAERLRDIIRLDRLRGRVEQLGTGGTDG
jgi:hypothetical protein